MRTFTYLSIPEAVSTSGSPSKTRCTSFSLKVLPFGLNTGFYSIGAYGDRLSAPSQDLGDTISRRLVDSPPGPPSFTPTSSSANKYPRLCRLYPKQKEIRAGPDSGSPVSRNPFTSGLGGSFPSRVQSLGDSCTCTPSILPLSTFSKVSHLMGLLNWASGLIPLGRLYLRPLQCHVHSLGLTDRFTPPRRVA